MPDPVRINVIDGTRDPELFTPPELFDELVSAAYHADVEVRELEDDFDGRLPADFWARLQAALAPYLAIVSETRGLVGQIGAADRFERARLEALLDDSTIRACSARSRAMQSARRELGDLFDRFLYDAVTDGLVTMDDANPAELERSRERAEGECE